MHPAKFCRFAQITGGAMRKFHIAMSMILAFAVAGCVSVAVNPPVIEAKPVTGTSGASIDPVKIKADVASLDLRPIGFTRVQTTIPRGSIIGEAHFKTLTCWYDTKLHYDNDRKMLRSTAYNDIFFTIFNGYGYNVVGNPNALFATAQSEPDLQVGASVNKIKGDLCRHVDSWSGKPDGNLSGTVKATVNWQIYDPARRRVIWQKDLEGTFTSPGPLIGDYDIFIQHAFADSANRLAADEGLRQILVQKPIREASVTAIPEITAPSRLVPRQRLFTGSIDGQIDHLRSATVLIEMGEAHGSGFIIREDGLIVTNQHVVGMQRFVRVRLLSGRMVIGEVLNRDDRRDIALVKLEGTGYPVIPVRETPVRVAEEVYAIGAPKFTSLSWTVTRGTISAYRQAEPPDMLDLIQSDVSTHGGNSGGPLLDRHGNLVGISVSGYSFDRQKTNASLNFFIPVLDGLQKLHLELADPAVFERARRTAATR